VKKSHQDVERGRGKYAPTRLGEKEGTAFRISRKKRTQGDERKGRKQKKSVLFL